MSSTGKVRVVVRSRKVPVGMTTFERPIFTSHGIFGKELRQAIVYKSIFDPRDEQALQDGRKLSSDYGLELEVVDLGKSSPIKRIALSLLRNSSPITIVQAPGSGKKEPTLSEPASTYAEPCSPSPEQSAIAS